MEALVVAAFAVFGVLDHNMLTSIWLLGYIIVDCDSIRILKIPIFKCSLHDVRCIFNITTRRNKNERRRNSTFRRHF